MDQTETKGSLPEIAEQVAHGLSKASMLADRAFIRTAVLFPSGSTVVVVIHDEGGGRFRVSDLGQGLEEADMLGISPAFRSQATEVAARSGIGFDGHAFLLTGAVADQLVGAVMTVANASSRALERAMLGTENRRSGAAVERLVARLVRIFPQAEVAREVKIRGEFNPRMGLRCESHHRSGPCCLRYRHVASDLHRVRGDQIPGPGSIGGRSCSFRCRAQEGDLW